MSSSPEQFVSLGWDNGHYLYIYPLLRKLIYMFSVCWGEKVTTQIVILQVQPEFSKIPSIPVYKTATDCTVTMETCSGFGSWFSDQKMLGSLYHGGDRVSLRGRPLEIQHQWRPSGITRSEFVLRENFHCVNLTNFQAKTRNTHRVWKWKISYAFTWFSKIVWILAVIWESMIF